jgi:hypothetical protein
LRTGVRHQARAGVHAVATGLGAAPGRYSHASDRKELSMFPGITAQQCATAWQLLLPSIAKAFELGLADAHRGAVLVYAPGATDAADPLFVGHVGTPDPQLQAWATGKARVTLRTGLASSRVGQDFPHLYVDGDIKWPGATLRDGLVVSFSGVQGEYDEMFAEWFISAIRAMSRVAYNTLDDASGPYLKA